MAPVPTKNSSGRYDNVDFSKATGHKLSPIKASYLRRDVLLFVSMKRYSSFPISADPILRPIPLGSPKTNFTSCMNSIQSSPLSPPFPSILLSSKQTKMFSTSSREQSALLSQAPHHLIHSDQSTEKEELRSCVPYHRAQKAWIWN
jgi:hypothetical protein